MYGIFTDTNNSYLSQNNTSTYERKMNSYQNSHLTFIMFISDKTYNQQFHKANVFMLPLFSTYQYNTRVDWSTNFLP